MAVSEILDVTALPLDPEQFWGGSVDAPSPGSQGDTYGCTIEGWLLGRRSPVLAVLVFENLDSEGEPAKRLGDCVAAVRLPRPDVAAQFPGVPGAANCGFRLDWSVFGLPAEFRVVVRAVLENGAVVPLAEIRGRYHGLGTGFEPGLQPIMVTSLGRSGSTWLMRLLSAHPGIAAQAVYPYETRAASYWVRLLVHVSATAGVPHNLAAAALGGWFHGTCLPEMAGFCQRTIDDFYREVAVGQGKPDARYFAEKCGPGLVPALLAQLYPGGREVILVRDFRDVYASALAFNAKRQTLDFGRQRAGSDEEYAKVLRVGALVLLDAWKTRDARAHLVRYEDLVRRPAESLVALFDYLGLGSTPSLVQGMLRTAAQETPELTYHKTSPDLNRSVQRWRRDLSGSLQAACQEAFADVLKEFGYKDGPLPNP
jgi:hypothetical protein